MMMMLVLLALLMISSLDAFKIFKAPRPCHSASQALSMGAFGVKKLGQIVIDTTVPPSQGSDSEALFRRPSVGAGTDDRIESDMTEAESYAKLSKINKSFEQRSLLMGLEGGSWGVPEKLERIRLASSVEGTLPSSTAFAHNIIKSSSLHAGGLMNEWDM